MVLSQHGVTEHYNSTGTVNATVESDCGHGRGNAVPGSSGADKYLVPVFLCFMDCINGGRRWGMPGISKGPIDIEEY